MNDFYLLSLQNIIILITIILTVGIMQGVSSFYYLVSNEQYRLGQIFNISLTYYSIYSIWHIIMIKEHFTTNSIVLYKYSNIYILSFLITISIVKLFIKLKLENVVYLVFLILHLSSIAIFFREYYILVYAGSWSLVGIIIVKKFVFHFRKASNEINIISIKDSMDKLTNGLLYSDDFSDYGEDVFLLNNSMRKILIEDLKIKSLNSKFIWEELIKISEFDDLLLYNNIYYSKSTEDDNIDMKTDDKIIVKTEQNNFYLFQLKKFKEKNKTINFISSNDITNKILLINQIKKDNIKLQNESSKLNKAIEIIENIEKNKILLEYQMMLHDILAQKISIIHYYLHQADNNSKEAIDEIVYILENLPKELNFDIDKNTDLMYKKLINTFKKTGLKIFTKGQFPKDKSLSMLYINIIREAATNAIKHSNSNNVWIEFGNSDSKNHLNITNDGFFSDNELLYGNGLNGILNRLKKFNGEMKIEIKDDLFSLKILI